MSAVEETTDSPGIETKIKALASALALGATAATLAAQLVEHFRKPKAAPGERTKAGTALLGLVILRQMPGLIRSARTLSAEFKRPK